MAKKDSAEKPAFSPINVIAYIITLSAVAFIFIISWYIVCKNKMEGARIVLTSVLPVLAGWVGTILAFFYSKQSLDSADRRVSELTSHITSAGKLQSIPVKAKWIPNDGSMFCQHESDYGKTLKALLEELESKKKGMRIPILDAEDRPLYIIHRSVIDQYLAKKGAVSTAKPDEAGGVNTITLKEFIDDKENAAIKYSVALVPEDATLDQAKLAMNTMSQYGWCQDVFVTKTGSKDEKVLGWVTNRIIEDNSKV
jgi:hypothetical protein